ncbi:Rtp1p SCDLUD_001155 [Saccharomycodes ludwigii]|uniref:Rtp1p n=1 Tax=Saccharomycodes ludwigii TaxID=36035 RepID=UPI001E86A2FB|nr:hypothetical protein SCDLUD_001155 [Saccharomycodes ludwigii]KAH3903514.1 hypothetical protein SCDLUD_001155 [Saccharomycodes ludwigii]
MSKDDTNNCDHISTKDVKIDDLLRRKPQFTKNTPIDNFFQDLDTNYLQKIKTTSIETFCYEDCGFSSPLEFVNELISKLLTLNKLLLDNQANEENCKKKETLLPISLHDMKYFELLVNLIIIQGIYANLPDGVGIPMEQRNLQDFKNTYRNKIFKISGSRTSKQNISCLKSIVMALYNGILKPESSSIIKELFLKGTGYSDILVGMLVLSLYDTDDHAYMTEEFENLESMQKTYNLYELYTVLFQSTAHLQVKQEFLNRLTTLPLKRCKDGVISLAEFILLDREQENEFRMDNLTKFVMLLTSKPKNIKSVEYFNKLFPQIRDGLTNINNSILVTSLNAVITDFYFKNKRIIYDFLFQPIYDVLFNLKKKPIGIKQLNDTINILISLSKQTNMELLKDLINKYNEYDFYLSLWRYANFVKTHPLPQSKDYHKIILNLIKTFMELTGTYKDLSYLILNFCTIDEYNEKWGVLFMDLEANLPKIILGKSSDIDILMANKTNKEGENHYTVKKLQQKFVNLDNNVNLFIELLKLINQHEITSDVFLSVLNRWVRNNEGAREDNTDASILVLSDLKLLEKMNQEFQTDIAKNPEEILALIYNLLDLRELEEQHNVGVAKHTKTCDNIPDSDDEDDETEDETPVDDSNDIFLLLLQLLSNIISVSDPQFMSETSLETLILIKTRLLAKFPQDRQATSLALRIEDICCSKEKLNNCTNGSNNDAEDADDKEILRKAIININDPLVPIRAQGLYMLRSLILNKSDVIDLGFVVDLHIHQLHDKDPFIYLNVIKGLVGLCEFKPAESLDILINYYRNKDSKKISLDDNLKIGEVLINYINLQNELFTGEGANKIIEVCLEKIRKGDNNISVDNRLRMSAMSLLGACLQVNASGLNPTYVSEILDCSFGILKFENDGETSKLMRRSAIHVIHDLLYNSGLENFPSEYSGANLQEILTYTRSKETDYLVCEQIDQVLKLIDEFIREYLKIDETGNSLLNNLKIK